MIWLIGKNGMLAKDILKIFDKNDIDYIATGSEIDISNIDVLNDFSKDKNIDVIINAAAYTKVDLAEEDIDNCYRVNSLGVKNIAEICSNIKAKLLHFSTDYVFDGKSSVPYKEDDKTNPINVYGKSKLEGEKYALLIDNSIIIRVSWLYGIYGKNFVSAMINIMKERDKLKVVGDQFGSPTYTEDVANIVLYIIKNFHSGLYHYTNEAKISWYDFSVNIYNLVKKYNISSKECIIEKCTTDEYPTKAQRPQYSILSKKKIINDYKVSLIDYEYSLKKFFDLYLNNNF